METSFVTFHSRFSGVSLLPLHPTVNYENFTLCQNILGSSQLDHHFLGQLLLGHLKLKDFWSNDLLPIIASFLNEPLVWFYG
jgi:hypothetical protein